MVQAIREIVRVGANGSVSVRASELPPGSDVEVIILATTPTSPKPSLLSFRGAGKGVYVSAAEADDFIRKERDQWE